MSESTVWPEQIWTKVKKSWLLPPQHQSTYPRGPESASIEIPPLRPRSINFLSTISYEVNLTSQRLHYEIILLSKFCSEKGGFNWCWRWGSICYELSTFIQMALPVWPDCGHTTEIKTRCPGSKNVKYGQTKLTILASEWDHNLMVLSDPPVAI